MARKKARIERQVEKQIKHEKKKARLVEAVAEEKTPRILAEPDTNKLARAGASPESIMQLQMSFDLFGYSDRDGAWTWGQERNWCTPEAKTGSGCAVRLAMSEMSQLTWAEILSQTTGSGKRRRKKHHSQTWDSLCDEAQERWVDIERTEEELFRFRVGGEQRIWGVRQGPTFFVVWWDAEHQIYPTEIS